MKYHDVMKFAVYFLFESSGIIMPLSINESILTKILLIVKVMLCLGYHYFTILSVDIKYSSSA